MVSWNKYVVCDIKTSEYQTTYRMPYTSNHKLQTTKHKPQTAPNQQSYLVKAFKRDKFEHAAVFKSHNRACEH